MKPNLAHGMREAFPIVQYLEPALGLWFTRRSSDDRDKRPYEASNWAAGRFCLFDWNRWQSCAKRPEIKRQPGWGRYYHAADKCASRCLRGWILETKNRRALMSCRIVLWGSILGKLRLRTEHLERLSIQPRLYCSISRPLRWNHVL